VPTSRSKAVWSYGAAVLAVAIALTITLYVLPLAERSQLFLLLAAVVLGAWYGGLGPGLVATAVAAAGQSAFFEPPYQDDIVRVLLFAVVAVAVAMLAAGQRRADERVRDQREELAVTLASIGDGVIVTDRAGRVTFMNSAAQRLTACAEAAVRGRALADVVSLLDEQTREPVASPMRRTHYLLAQMLARRV